LPFTKVNQVFKQVVRFQNNDASLGVTFFGIFLTPVFFSVIMKFFGRKPVAKTAPRPSPERELQAVSN
jgi:hypothetical protein